MGATWCILALKSQEGLGAELLQKSPGRPWTKLGVSLPKLCSGKASASYLFIYFLLTQLRSCLCEPVLQKEGALHPSAPLLYPGLLRPNRCWLESSASWEWRDLPFPVVSRPPSDTKYNCFIWWWFWREMALAAVPDFVPSVCLDSV